MVPPTLLPGRWQPSRHDSMTAQAEVQAEVPIGMSWWATAADRRSHDASLRVRVRETLRSMLKAGHTAHVTSPPSLLQASTLLNAPDSA